MKEFPRRRQLRLKGYDYTQNGMYFITICTEGRQCLLGKIVGATLCGRPNNPDKMIERWLMELENKFIDVTICNYVIMPNHIHFVLLKMAGSGDRIGSGSGDHI